MMTKLEELINELCPDGIEYKPLEECCIILDKQRKPVTKSARQKGEYRYYGANGIQDYVSDYIFDGTFVLVGEDGSVMTSNGKPIVNWAEGKIWVNNHAHIIAEKEGTSLRYLYHLLQTIDVRNLIHGNIPKLTQGDFKSLQIPLPPLSIQSEIVHILDSFTLLTAQLTAELTARQKQYEYYRDTLLSFDDKACSHIVKVERERELTRTKAIKWLSIQDLFNLRNGYTPSKSKSEYWTNGTIPWFRMEDIRENGHILNDSIQHITPIAVKGKLFPANSIILATSATIGEHALITVDSLANQRFTYLTVKNEYSNQLNMKYIYYYFFKIDEWCKNNLNISSFASVDMDKFKKLKFPIPPLEEQERIVSILDRFDKLCNDISEGLPAEIKARQKQYEYYRDKLLTFKMRN